MYFDNYCLSLEYKITVYLIFKKNDLILTFEKISNDVIDKSWTAVLGSVVNQRITSWVV